MHRTITLLALLLAVPVLTGCIATDAEVEDGLPAVNQGTFSVGNFVQDLEKATGASLVNARVDSLQVEYNQSRTTLVEWRSFTRHGESCEMVSTMVYEGQGRKGGFLVHQEDEPCPLSLQGKPTVAEAVALVDRVPLTMVQDQVLSGAQVFSVALAGTCGYQASEDGDPVYVWNGAGV
ncbi:MAG: hypothetical protein R3185_09225, partial [Candidatus Thermoplasmatota archaeon]|nr:hypothetical protein [Candidatus Thermoplasmatota archaeon]